MYALLFKDGNCEIIKNVDVVIVEHNNVTVSSMVNGSTETEYRSTSYISYNIRIIDSKKWLNVIV